MRFLCPNCNAKYQIADEKVAGKTVHMKCRKCGHIIPITGPGAADQGAEGLEADSDIEAAAMSVRAPVLPMSVRQPSPIPPKSPAKPFQSTLASRPSADALPTASVPLRKSVPKAVSTPSSSTTSSSTLSSTSAKSAPLPSRGGASPALARPSSATQRQSQPSSLAKTLSSQAIPRQAPSGKTQSSAEAPAFSARLSSTGKAPGPVVRPSSPRSQGAAPVRPSSSLARRSSSANAPLPAPSSQAASALAARSSVPGRAPVPLRPSLPQQPLLRTPDAQVQPSSSVPNRPSTSGVAAPARLSTAMAGMQALQQPLPSFVSTTSVPPSVVRPQTAANLALSRPSAPSSSAQIPAVAPPHLGVEQGKDGDGGWFLGLGSNAVGPLELAQVEQKIQQGLVDQSVLAWRVGLPGWVPVSACPQLMQLVRKHETAQAAAVTPPPLPNVAQAAVMPPPLPSGTQAAGVQSTVQSAAQPAVQSAERAAQLVQTPLPDSKQPAVGQPPVLRESPATPAGASPKATDAAAGPPSSSDVAGVITQDPFAETSSREAAHVASPDLDSSYDDLEPAPKSRRRGLAPIYYVLIALAFGFGVTGAVVLFSYFTRDQVPGVVQAVTAAEPVKQDVPIVAQDEPQQDNSQPKEPEKAVALDSLPVVKAEANSSKAVSTASDPKPAASAEHVPLPKVGLGSAPVIAGPSLSDNSSGAIGSVGSQLEQSDIERVVSSQRAGVRRRCWEPAIAANPHGKKSTKVIVAMTIGANGRVTGAAASGGDGFPGLAECIASSVRSWKFPASSGSTQTNVPFSFFVQ